MVNVNPTNCDIEINNTKIKQNKVYEQIFTQENDKYKQLDLYYQIKLPENINKENCYFYVGASESSKELPTLLREDIPYSRTLSYNISNATFILLYKRKYNN